MFEASNTIHDPGVCATCGSLAIAGRYVQMAGASLRAFCSEACLAAGFRAQSLKARATRHRATRGLALGIIALGAWVPLRERPWRATAPVAPVAVVESAGPEPLPPGWFGPEWPPTEASVLAVLGRDAWVHPLAGPARRMPRSDTRVFGAVRPGNRAIECRNGHCGVDLGGEIWGEHVRAAHDGVVDWVQRGPNPDHGGRFVRLSHHDGTVFTQYFHLAAIPRGLERGVAVKGGQVIGLLGDSGVKESQPHLHFAVSVRVSEDGRERYIDPEPLIALWPLRIPVDGSETGLVTITGPPGVPLGSAARRSSRARKGVTPGAAPEDDAPGAPADDAEPAAETETDTTPSPAPAQMPSGEQE